MKTARTFTVEAALKNAYQITELDRNFNAFINRFAFGVSYSVKKVGTNRAYTFTFEQAAENAQRRATAIISRVESKYIR